MRDGVSREAANKVARGTRDPAGSSGIGFSLAVPEKWGLHIAQHASHMQSVCVHFVVL